MAKIKPKKKKRKYKTRWDNPEFKEKVLKAIEGSGGVIALIARKLSMKYMATWTMIQNAPEDIHKVIEREKEYVGDVAEVTVREMMEQRIDFGTASRTALSILKSKRYADRGFEQEKQLTLQGGKKPIEINSNNLVSIDKLKGLPIEMRKSLLSEIEETEEETDEE